MNPNKITPETLAPHTKHWFGSLLKALPGNIASRLKCSAKPRANANHRGMLLFNIWDRNQNDILPLRHFCYCLGYNPLSRIPSSSVWYFHLWINTTRIARDREAIAATLESDVRRVTVPEGFERVPAKRGISIQMDLTFFDPTDMIGQLLPASLRLISAYHPILIPIIDQMAELRREEMFRAVPWGWRAEIVAGQNHACAICGADLREVSAHIDHIVPFSRGGTTDRGNLHALCPACNTRKGNQNPCPPSH